MKIARLLKLVSWKLSCIGLATLVLFPALALGAERSLTIQTIGHQGESLGGIDGNSGMNAGITVVVTDSLDGSLVTGLAAAGAGFPPPGWTIQLKQGPLDTPCQFSVQSLVELSEMPGVYVIEVGLSGCTSLVWREGEYLYYIDINRQVGDMTTGFLGRGSSLGVITIEGAIFVG